MQSGRRRGLAPSDDCGGNATGVPARPRRRTRSEASPMMTHAESQFPPGVRHDWRVLRTGIRRPEVGRSRAFRKTRRGASPAPGGQRERLVLPVRGAGQVAARQAEVAVLGGGQVVARGGRADGQARGLAQLQQEALRRVAVARHALAVGVPVLAVRACNDTRSLALRCPPAREGLRTHPWSRRRPWARAPPGWSRSWPCCTPAWRPSAPRSLARTSAPGWACKWRFATCTRLDTTGCWSLVTETY